MGRRTFLFVLFGSGDASHLPAAAMEQARRIVDSGVLGRVWFCRVPSPQMAEAVLGRHGPVIGEVDPHAPGAVLCGSRATLFCDGAVCRLFRPDAV
jgi:hypothetical protein